MSDNAAATIPDGLQQQQPVVEQATEETNILGGVENQQPPATEAESNNQQSATTTREINNGEMPTSFIENEINTDRANMPTTLKLGSRNNTFYETKLDIKREMEERNKREFDVWGKETYLNAIKQSNLIPMAIALRQLPTEELNLSHRVIDAQDLRPLCLSLHTNANISSLKLDDNSIGIDGAKWLLTALKENVAVRELSLADNHLGNGVCSLVAELLATNRNLISVNLAGNLLDDRAGRDIGAILEITFTLKALNLARNKLSDGAADEISNSLKYNDSVENFNLEWNNFMPYGCRLIFKGIQKNLGVRHFCFMSNGTDDTCTQSIADMLASNHVLQNLDVSSSRLSDKSTSIIINQGLAKNDALEQLNLSNNLLSETSLLQYFEFIRTSPSCPPLKKVLLQTVPIKATTAEKIMALKEERSDAAVIVPGPVVVGVVGRKPGPPIKVPDNKSKTANAENNVEETNNNVAASTTETVVGAVGGDNIAVTPGSRQGSQVVTS